MSRLFVSTIIPTFNRANLITRAVSSALRESIPGDEVIVVDNGSTDGTDQELAPLMNRIRYIRTSQTGAGPARNRGIKEARNQLIAFLDSDDEWMPGKIKLQRALMQVRPDILFCFSNFAVTDNDGNEKHYHLKNWHKDPRSWDEILGQGTLFSTISPLPDGVRDFEFYVGNLYSSMIRASYVNTDTLMVRRNEAGEALYFAGDLPLFEDWECFSRLAGRGLAAYLDCETAWQHGHAGERLTDGDILRRTTTAIVVIERVWGKDPLFLKQEQNLYGRTLSEQRLRRAVELISLGRTGDARAELRYVGNVPLPMKLISAFPGPLARTVLALRRFVRRLLTAGGRSAEK